MCSPVASQLTFAAARTICAQEYRATGLLGCSTDSYDSDGRRVRSAPFQHVTREKVEAVLDQFRGEIKQLPPIYSAIKMDGKPLYDYARQNLPLPRAIEKRDCTIYNLELINFKQGHDHSWKGSEREVTDAERETMERLERLVAENATSASASTSDASAGTSTEEAHIVTSSGPETVAPTEQANEGWGNLIDAANASRRCSRLTLLPPCVSSQPYRPRSRSR